MIRHSIFLCIVLTFFSEYSASGQKYLNMAGHFSNVVLSGISGSKKNIYEKNTKLFLDAVNKGYKTNKPPSIPSGIVKSDKVNQIIGNLWAVSPFLSVRTDVIENLLSSGKGNFEIRNLQIVLEEAQSGYEQQDAVLIFDDKGLICDFKIALGYHSISTILRDTVSVTDLRRRQMIIDFVENFRTAYNLKNIAFIDTVFSNKALIITGKVISQTRDGELQPNIEYRHQTKSEYLSNLKMIFAKSKMININYDSLTVVRHPSNTDLYGVTLTQTWNSELIGSGGNYHDIGYVFLIIDFFNEEKPKIWVRTWQDKRYVGIDHGVFSFNHFNIK